MTLQFHVQLDRLRALSTRERRNAIRSHWTTAWQTVPPHLIHLVEPALVWSDLKRQQFGSAPIRDLMDFHQVVNSLLESPANGGRG